MSTPAYMKPHSIEDRHGFLVCSCGWVPRGANASLLSNASHYAETLLRLHIAENDDRLCHWKKYGMDCILPNNHDGIHRDGAR